MTSELYKKYRPRLFKRVIGQEGIVKTLSKMIKSETVPHTILFSGPSGCGKTTLARILAKKLDCSNADLNEINCADFRGIDMVRDIRDSSGLCALAGGNRVWIIDEAHQLSSQAQHAFLKLLEDTPSHVFFFLATTSPNKLLPTIRNRCTTFVVKELSTELLETLVDSICKKEQITLGTDAKEKLIEIAEGSPRKALVLLDQVRHTTEDNQLSLLESSDTRHQAIELARALIRPNSSWNTVAKILKEVEEDPESLRWMILGYARTVLLGGGNLSDRAYLIIECFREPFYDSKAAGLTAACWEVMKGIE